MPSDSQDHDDFRSEVLQWMFFVHGGVGQCFFFLSLFSFPTPTDVGPSVRRSHAGSGEPFLSVRPRANPLRSSFPCFLRPSAFRRRPTESLLPSLTRTLLFHRLSSDTRTRLDDSTTSSRSSSRNETGSSDRARERTRSPT
jgi:hypothetical protein